MRVIRPIDTFRDPDCGTKQDHLGLENTYWTAASKHLDVAVG